MSKLKTIAVAAVVSVIATTSAHAGSVTTHQNPKIDNVKPAVKMNIVTKRAGQLRAQVQSGNTAVMDQVRVR